ncbi:MAG: hypothetical protein M1834_001438 [Cirrosporium novae-zelandiae]|nr:MAG: hypothetical protein M1834_001438 [Cirrosporium novae-zelandiae]
MSTPKAWQWDVHYDFPRDLKGYGENSFNPQWPNGAKIALSFAINYEEASHPSYPIQGGQGCASSVLNGDHQSEVYSIVFRLTTLARAVNVESEYDYGARAGAWRLFRLFNKHNIKYTLYAVGKAIEENLAVAVSSVQNGHDVASHAYRWIDYHAMPPETEKEYIRKGIEAITRICGKPPNGWNCERA